MSLKTLILRTPLRCLWEVYKRIAQVERRRCHAYFAYDEERFWRYSGAWKGGQRKEAQLAGLTVSYHVIEKGLTMPARRLGFGQGVVKELVGQIEAFAERYGSDDSQIRHAVGVVRAYHDLHVDAGYRFEDRQLWDLLNDFLSKHREIPAAVQHHVTREEFYVSKNADFAQFSRSRHTVRNFDSSRGVEVAKIRCAVRLAMTAPSACNRQHAAVYCLSNRDLCLKVLQLQGGNRGFGHLADKVLIVTADTQRTLLPRERNDAFVNGGMFLMNLCYALHHEEVAHCILTWAQNPDVDQELRRLVPIKNSEVVIALLACGEAPAEFNVAASPRRDLESVLTMVP